MRSPCHAVPVTKIKPVGGDMTWRPSCNCDHDPIVNCRVPYTQFETVTMITLNGNVNHTELEPEKRYLYAHLICLYYCIFEFRSRVFIIGLLIIFVIQVLERHSVSFLLWPVCTVLPGSHREKSTNINTIIITITNTPCHSHSRSHSHTEIHTRTDSNSNYQYQCPSQSQ